MATTVLTSSPEACAAAVGDVLDGVFGLLDAWRQEVMGAFDDTAPVAALDELVAGLVLPELAGDGLLIGAGFVAAPDFVRDRDVHFAWWLGPLDAGPIFGSTSEPTRLDLTTRGYADYLRDVRTLEWWATPASTQSAHVTGPYVDHLCTCDYILTLTMPAILGDRMVGVIGADIAVRRLEREVIPLLLAADEPLALVNATGRVVASTAPTAYPGTIVSTADSVGCGGTSLRIARLGGDLADKNIANRMITL